MKENLEENIFNYFENNKPHKVLKSWLKIAKPKINISGSSTFF